MRPPTFPVNCGVCGVGFASNRPWACYCSAGCRYEARKARRRALGTSAERAYAGAPRPGFHSTAGFWPTVPEVWVCAETLNRALLVGVPFQDLCQGIRVDGRRVVFDFGEEA